MRCTAVPYCPIPGLPTVSQISTSCATCSATLTPGLVVRGRRRTLRADAVARHRGGGPRWCRATPSSHCWPHWRPRRQWMPRCRPPARHHQVPVHQRLDQAAQGRDQHHAHVVRQPAADGARACRRGYEEPPVLVDWLPWNHTFGGNHNFGMTVTTAARCTSTTASPRLH